MAMLSFAELGSAHGFYPSAGFSWKGWISQFSWEILPGYSSLRNFPMDTHMDGTHAVQAVSAPESSFSRSCFALTGTQGGRGKFRASMGALEK
jgi:hypothetical protein